MAGFCALVMWSFVVEGWVVGFLVVSWCGLLVLGSPFLCWGAGVGFAVPWLFA